MSTEERVARLENELARVKYVAAKTRRTVRNFAYQLMVSENVAKSVSVNILFALSQAENEEQGKA